MEFLGKKWDIKTWGEEQLGPRIAVDTETTFVPFTETPDLITLQVCDGAQVYYVPLKLSQAFFQQHSKAHFIFHNASFDIDVLCKYWDNRNAFHEMIENDQVYDTSIMYRLLHLATVGFVPHGGQWSLAYISQKFLNVELDKNDDIRNNFEQWQNRPLSEIPMDFLEYGAKDAIATWYCYNSMLPYVSSTGTKTCLTHTIQIAGSLALNRIYKRGIGFDLEKSQKLKEEIELEMNQLQERLATYGWVRGIKGCNDRYAEIVRDYYQLPLPVTETGVVSSKAEDLENYKDNPFVAAYLKFHELEKQLSFFGDLNEPRIHPRYNPILNTGRTSCSKPNFQQLPRAGRIRGLFVAKPSHIFIITDYAAIELATLAQTLYHKYGHSTMLDKINAGEDLHKYYASIYFNKPIEEITKFERQCAKAANFGFPGGLGIDTFITFSKGYGLDLTHSEAQKMKNAWFRAFPEVKKYLSEETEDAWTLTGRKRANTTYCASKNTPFQGLAADGAKIALYYLDHAGFQVVGFVHDEIICEVPTSSAHELKTKQEKIMIQAMEQVCPDVTIAVDSTLSREYCK